MTKRFPDSWHNAWTILCDFDGTISAQDVTDTLLEHFGRPGWQDLEEQWLAGEIGSRECMAGQIALLDMSRQALDELLATIPVDPDFSRFVALAERYQIPVHVVSDGLDYPIYHLLARQGITQVPVVANLLKQVDERRWELTFPWQSDDCRAASGVCKCATMQQRSRGATLLIGDGRSDFCLAHQATHVFARGALLRECQQHALAHSQVDNFAMACEQFVTLLGKPVHALPVAPFNPLTPWKQR